MVGIVFEFVCFVFFLFHSNLGNKFGFQKWVSIVEDSDIWASSYLLFRFKGKIFWRWVFGFFFSFSLNGCFSFQIRKFYSGNR